jgi:hypothetical protein
MSDTWTATKTGASSSPPHRRRPSRTPLFLLVGLIVVALVGGTAWYFTAGENDGEPGAGPTDTRPSSPAPSPAPTETIAEFSGTGNDTSDTFDVEGTWYIVWENEGDVFKMAITGDHDFGTVVRQQEPGSGRVQSVAGGAYQLEIVAKGRWSAEIIQEVVEDR